MDRANCIWCLHRSMINTSYDSVPLLSMLLKRISVSVILIRLFHRNRTIFNYLQRSLGTSSLTLPLSCWRKSRPTKSQKYSTANAKKHWHTNGHSSCVWLAIRKSIIQPSIRPIRARHASPLTTIRQLLRAHRPFKHPPGTYSPSNEITFISEALMFYSNSQQCINMDQLATGIFIR